VAPFLRSKLMTTAVFRVALGVCPMSNEEDFFSFPLRLSNEVQELFDEMIHSPWGCNRQLRTWSPSVDLYETEDAFVLEADLPGVKAEDVHVKIDGNELVLQGQRVMEHSRSDGRFHTMERRAGEFMRRISLPESVDKEAMQVKFNDGVLQLVMPKVTLRCPPGYAAVRRRSHGSE
jgi:HSP20 family molecular chaperone IbpA